MEVIGIAGPSCSGKSTVSSIVSSELNNAPVICLDYQYIKGSPDIFYKGVRTFERPELYDGAGLASIIEKLKVNNTVTFSELKLKQFSQRTVTADKYVILEGFLLYQYPQIRDICDLMFYIDVPWEEMVRRRKARPIYAKADEGFFVIGKHETETYVEPQKYALGVQTLNGMLRPQAIASIIVQKVIKH